MIKKYILLCCLTISITFAQAQNAQNEEIEKQKTERNKAFGAMNRICQETTKWMEKVITDLAISIRTSQDVTAGLNSFTEKYSPSSTNFKHLLKDLKLKDYSTNNQYLDKILNVLNYENIQISEEDMIDVVEYITTISHQLLYSTNGTYEQMNQVINGNNNN